MENILEVKNLSVSFNTQYGEIQAVRDVSFDLKKGETLAIVGESGCGKSVLCKTIMKLLPSTAYIKNGSVIVDGADITNYSDRHMRHLRGRTFSMICQDPMSSLNPTLTVGFQIAEAVKAHSQDLAKSQIKERVMELMKLVGIDTPAERYGSYPYNFSGGQRQRLVMAIALASSPKILFADEPTTSLDVTIQAQIVDLMRDLKDEFNTAIILITHDLGVVAGIADKVAVMYAGEIVEEAKVDDLYYHPLHPYTWGLLKALPRLDMKENELRPIPGSTPDLLLERKGCPFFDRCEYAMECCKEHRPDKFVKENGHSVKCWRYHEDFKEVE